MLLMIATDLLSKQINVRFSDEEYDQLDAIAKRTDRTLSYVVRNIVRQTLNQEA